MGKSTISMAIFNSYVKLPEGNISHIKHHEATKETPCSKTFENLGMKGKEGNGQASHGAI